MQKLLESFIPCADEVWYLQNRPGPEGEFFRSFCEKGHYGGRTKPSSTRQGIYAVAPSGEFLASINTNDARAMAGMLKKAMAAWDALPEEKRARKDAPEAEPEGRRRGEQLYPADGLVLKSFVRDLPRDGDAPATDRERRLRRAWNHDFAWFRKDEAAAFIPESAEVGATRDVPITLVRRLARFNLLDIVRGQTEAFPDEAIERAELTVEIAAVEGDVLRLRLRGATRAKQELRTGVKGYGDMDDPRERERGYDAKLLGTATWDRAKGRFTSFELMAAGSRWGGTLYNGRGDDLDPAPMGVYLTLAGDGPEDRVAPAFVWAYGWR